MSLLFCDASSRQLHGKEHVTKIAQKLTERDQYFVLDMDSNQFSPDHLFGNSEFLELLSSSNCKFISIIGNEAATVESLHYLSTLNLQLMAKLIWVPNVWVDGKGWKICLKEAQDMKEREQTVLEAHRTFYKWQSQSFEIDVHNNC